MRRIYSFLLCMFSFAITVNAKVTLQQDTTSNAQVTAATVGVPANSNHNSIVQPR